MYCIELDPQLFDLESLNDEIQLPDAQSTFSHSLRCWNHLSVGMPGFEASETPNQLQVPQTSGRSEASKVPGSLVVRLFQTPPRIFGASVPNDFEDEQANHSETSAESVRYPLEAEALSLSRMLKSLSASESFPGFSAVHSLAEAEPRHEVVGGKLSEAVHARVKHVSSGVEEQRLVSEIGSGMPGKDANDILYAGNSSPAFHNPRVAGSSKTRRTPGGSNYSEKGGDSGSSAGSSAELQFPTTNIQSPPSPEPLRPSSPLRWRSRISSVVSPLEDVSAFGEVMETPVQGLVASNLSFSEYITGKILFGRGGEYGAVGEVFAEPSKVVEKSTVGSIAVIEEPLSVGSEPSQVIPQTATTKERVSSKPPPSENEKPVLSRKLARKAPAPLKTDFSFRDDAQSPVKDLENDQQSFSHDSELEDKYDNSDYSLMGVGSSSSSSDVYYGATQQNSSFNFGTGPIQKPPSVSLVGSPSVKFDRLFSTSNETSVTEGTGRELEHKLWSKSFTGIPSVGSIKTYGAEDYPNLSGIDDPEQSYMQQRKKGECYVCHKGRRMTDKEACLVCNSKFCYNCVLIGMESMHEGRKCKKCIGKPISDSKRSCIGKPSRLLNRLLSPQEVQQIMKAEKECAANQLRPEQVYVNGKTLSSEELLILIGCSSPPTKLKPGKYWYDKQTGFWGKEGEKPDKLISPDLRVGGPLSPKASNGATQVFLNGRELGKLEWKMLKLAGVHCPPKTRLWVGPDGSYQEEGQKFWKGNIWKKTSIRLLYPFFSLPTPGANSRLKDDQQDLPCMYTPDYLKQNKQYKLLLLGHEGSGRSTIYKQTKFLFKDGFTSQELQKMKAMIQGNIFKYISVLLESRERFEDEDDDFETRGSSDHNGHKLAQMATSKKNIYALDERLNKTAKWVLEVMAEGCVETLSTASREYAPLVDELWHDPAVKATYRRIMKSSDHIQGLPDVAEYFLDRVLEMSSKEYEPREEDILRAEGLAQGSGLAEVQFYLEDKVALSGPYQDVEPPSVLGRYQLIKVGGNGMAEGHKWLDMFEDVHVIIFCVAMSEYDQVWTDSNGVQQTKMLQTELFDSVLKHPSFTDKPFVLLLNKYDIFEDKICKGIPLTTCEWFSDFRPVGACQNSTQMHAHLGQMQAQQGYTYVVHKYKELFASAGHKVFTFKLNATERDKVLEAFQYIREILKWKKSEWEMIPEESSYSTDLSSFSRHMFTSGRDTSQLDMYSQL